MKLKSTPLVGLCLCGFLTLVSGCTSAGLNFNMFAEPHEKESDENFVEQVIPVWQEAEGAGLNPASVSKGFGGHIYFITHGRGLPSEVKGAVRIYIFDDLGTPEEQAKPIHQFDFPAESWKGHLAMSKLGPSYSIFVPYTRTGGRAANCALRIRYTPEKGAPVFSQMVAIAMPGTGAKAPGADDNGDNEGPEVTQRGKQKEGKINQVSGVKKANERDRVKTLGYELPSGHQSVRPLNARGSSARTQSRTARDAFVGTDEDDLPENEESVADLLSDLDEPADSTRNRITPAAAEESDEPSLRTYTIPLK